jgi:hypothetical protein
MIYLTMKIITPIIVVVLILVAVIFGVSKGNNGSSGSCTQFQTRWIHGCIA